MMTSRGSRNGKRQTPAPILEGHDASSTLKRVAVVRGAWGRRGTSPDNRPRSALAARATALEGEAERGESLQRGA